ncbi:hypothetical protein HYH02_013961 [Chlamydomonas schloesseri]|uniref:Micro-fibrillar-associated protein 1 C-terminal domain-containing protein n=1 Tax=Chlamydomonas schloesseri TaxID=2026947 RepID=A0A835VXY1_9CHLO|nr:hypothetical protein HYH02_013961 [Chlamydomonas schloesseri]|eukprot:KAG2429704.1 hypothetical protein HYH02_013961 [Chlamydomonas schloesseri]
MSGAFAARTAQEEADKGRVDRTRVKRYWPGKAPEWADQQEEAEAAAAPRERVRTEVAAPVIVRRADDARLARLQQSRGADREEALQERRQIRAAEIVRVKRERSEELSSEGGGGSEDGGGGAGPQLRRRERARSEEPGGSEEEAEEEDDEGPQLRRRRREASEEPEAEPALEGDVPADEMRRRVAARRQADDEDDEDAVARRRAAVRERLLQQQREEEERRKAQQQEEEEEEEEEEESSEYETDDEDDGPGGRLLKPVFVPKHARDTVAERTAQEEEEEAAAEKEKARKMERKEETKAILAEQMAAEVAAAAAAAAGPAGLDDIDTDDDDEEAVGAYEAWKGRELRRIKRDREERETAEREAAERERLKNMTEEERAAWEKANPKASREASPKAKWNFLQKYWHKGAFFQEAADDTRGTTGVDEIFKRDFSAPTGMDKFDKSALPKVMQVKNFGRAGRTKYTHLLDQDTTQVEDELYAATKDNIVRRKEQALAAAQVFAKPKKFRR